MSVASDLYALPGTRDSVIGRDEIDPESSSTAYNSACLFTQLGDYDRALDLVERAVDLGGRNQMNYETDIDFDPIREHPRFIALMQRI